METERNTLKKEASKSAHPRPPRFDLIAGNVCLDFVNTLDDRHTQPKELLTTYGDLVAFGEDTGLLDDSQAERLLRRSHHDPEKTHEVLVSARELREAIHDIFWATINQRPVSAAALAKLNAYVQAAAAHTRLVPLKASFAWSYGDDGELDRILWPIARAAADLLASDQVRYVRACFSKTCEWFFLDTSKSHQRRWCDMARCGNRAKVQAFYERNK